MSETIDARDQGLPRHTLEGWIDAIRQYQIARPAPSSEEPAWETLTYDERLARIRSIRGKYKDLTPSWEFNRRKQDEIDRE